MPPHVPIRPSASDSPVDYSQKWWVLLSVAMGIFLSTIDGSIVNVSLPTLERAFDTSFATVQWVVVSYLLVITSLMLGVARLGDMIGKRRIYLAGMAVFTGGSLLCGISPSIGALIGFRAFQGVGAVMMQALGITGTIVSLGISIGPTVGGVLIGTVGWHWIFLVNLPVGIVGLWLGRRYIPDWRPPGGQRFDVVGAVLTFGTLVMLALGLTFGPERGWSDPAIRSLLLGALVAFLLFLLVESRLRQPMIDLKMFRDSLFSISLLTGLLVFMVFAGLFMMPFYLERVKGYEPAQVGLFLVVVPVALGVTAPIAGSLSDRYGTRGISLLGLVIVALACLSIASLEEDTSAFGYVVRLLPLGLGAGLFQSPNNSAIMGSAPRARLGVASGLLSLSRTLGQVTGLPLMGALFASRVLSLSELPAGVDASEGPPWAIVEGLEFTFGTAAIVIAVAIVLAAVGFGINRRRLRANGSDDHRRGAPAKDAALHSHR